MVLKCILLMYYKNSRGRNYRRQVYMAMPSVNWTYVIASTDYCTIVLESAYLLMGRLLIHRVKC